MLNIDNRRIVLVVLSDPINRYRLVFITTVLLPDSHVRDIESVDDSPRDTRK